MEAFPVLICISGDSFTPSCNGFVVANFDRKSAKCFVYETMKVHDLSYYARFNISDFFIRGNLSRVVAHLKTLSPDKIDLIKAKYKKEYPGKSPKCEFGWLLSQRNELFNTFNPDFLSKAQWCAKFENYIDKHFVLERLEKKGLFCIEPFSLEKHYLALEPDFDKKFDEFKDITSWAGIFPIVKLEGHRNTRGMLSKGDFNRKFHMFNEFERKKMYSFVKDNLGCTRDPISGVTMIQNIELSDFFSKKLCHQFFTAFPQYKSLISTFINLKDKATVEGVLLSSEF